MSSDIPIAFVTSNFQTNPFPEKAGPGSEGSTRVGACQAPSSQWMLRTPQTKFSAGERSCPRVTHQHPKSNSVSEKAHWDWLHPYAKDSRNCFINNSDLKEDLHRKKNIFQFKRSKTLKYSQLRDFSSQWMAASRWQHPKLPHQSAACACTEFPHLGMTEKQWPTGFIYIYLYTMGGYHQYHLHVSAGNWFPRRKLLLIPCRLLPPSRVHTRDRDRATAQVIHTHMQ